ncbi:MAG: histidine kinase [Flavobacteriaceae bacterium]|nr:histidine kinase [Flavobacteriaceae bacterium]
MDNLNQNPLELILYLLLAVSFLVTIAVIYIASKDRKKTKKLLQKVEEIKRFDEEFTNTKIEIQEQTLKNLSWELHDNIGQLLSVAKMQLLLLSKKMNSVEKEGVLDTVSILSKTLQDVRLLSRTLNYEVLNKLSLEEAIRIELGRFDRLGLFETTLEVEGEAFKIESKEATVIFRVFQEIFSNVVKHAEAKQLSVSMHYTAKTLKMRAIDDGKGFDLSQIEAGCGLLHMKSRAKLIQAQLLIKSQKQQGTEAILIFNK